MPTAVQDLFWKLQEMGCRPRQLGKGYSALCPVHEADGGKHTPSLTFSEGTTQPVVVNCHAGCGLGDILSAVDMSIGEIMNAVVPNDNGKGTQVAKPSGTTEKNFSDWMDRLFSDPARRAWLEQSRHLSTQQILASELGWDGGYYTLPVRSVDGRLAFVKRYNPEREPRYLLPPKSSVSLYGIERLAALPDGHLVVVTEGEFDAMICRSNGLEAVSTTGGAKAWKGEWSVALKRFEVVVAGDNDEPGAEYSKKVCESIRVAGGTAEILEWPAGTPDKADASSYIPLNGAEDFHSLIHSTQRKNMLNRVDIATIFSTELQPIPWVLEGWLAEGDVAILAGEPGAGKSMVLLDLALSLATGRDFLKYMPMSGKPKRVLVVDEENNERICRRRLQQFLLGYELDDNALRILPLRYLTDNFLCLDDEKALKRFHRELGEFQPDWVMLDSLVRFHARDENSNSAMSQFYTDILKPISRNYQCGLVMLHHLSKPSKDKSSELGHRLRGASDLRGMVDELWMLEGNTDTNERVLRHEKCRWDMLHHAVRMTYHTTANDGGAWLQGGERNKQASEHIEICLRSAHEAGMLRTEIVETLSDEGFKAAERIATTALAVLGKHEKVCKRREGKGMRYWSKEFFKLQTKTEG